MAQPKRIFRPAYLYDGDRQFVSPAEVYVADGRIQAVVEANVRDHDADALRRAFADAEHVDLPYCFLLPGLVNSHHHFYSALARGIPAVGPLPNFPAILESLWWRFDRVLNKSAVGLSALVSAIDSVRHGCTTVIDHHSSPRAARGSLQEIAAAARPLNLATVLCYEISDRNGPTALAEAVEENLECCAATGADPHSRGLFGLHASFTLSEDSLRRIARARPSDIPIHAHVAEDTCDVEHARSLGYEGPLARLHAHGLLDDRSLIAHAVHLSSGEVELARELSLWVVHNPESNCNNGVGLLDVSKHRPDRILLGTDGMNSNMLGTLRSAFLLSSGFGSLREGALERICDTLFRNPSQYASALFGRPIGRVAEGELADFAVFPYHSPTPVTSQNYLAHIVYALSTAPQASWVYANGQPVLEAGRLTTVDEVEVLAEAREVSARLWEKFRKP